MAGEWRGRTRSQASPLLAEFDFRYNSRAKLGFDDNARHDLLLAATGGKRLTYRRAGEAAH